MENYLLEWANLLLRWLHVVTAIAWVGSSFYFVWLDNHLVKPTSPDLLEKGVEGALWAVHGGGFYNPQKYLAAPRKIHTTLHWFYWESYSTWLSGFALFVLLYLWQAGSYLIDPRVQAWSNAAAVATALAFLAGFWLLYDLLCRALGGRRHGERWLGVALIAVVVAAAWAACQLFAGRAAFLITGAMIATAMSANVFFVIIPGQRKTVAAMLAGAAVDARHGQRAKQRSVHNTYFTLPVLVAMLSIHYPMLTQHEQNWLVLAGLMALGVLVRLFFVLRHKGRVQWELVIASVALIAGLMVLVAPERSGLEGKPAAAADAPAASEFAQVQAIVAARCAMCHNAGLAQKGVQLHSAEKILAQAQAIRQQAVLSRTMPLNNATGMSEAERALLGRWVQGGAKAD